eukprot:CAMPEP_0197663966 /NCGR_PEP_ID=MMETSP1338-20131121/58349_1 /TAXON_ID=43686 ORGANISM="Pelagodinium beii, Strain RCC1491" /NCGR_SAMPLE_ID=MMETSP1338 /ASSEMBLY_ACC=CAM_ASM_000754 /LENGTH=400 /DNA_ID=CAMNT_0043242507 /DNA_START=32 /DNA_END=1234 /DNA_ORIENTATION=+
MTSPVPVESLTTAAALTVEEAAPQLEEDLRKSLSDGFLSDVVECSAADVKALEAIAPWKDFNYRLFRSPAATSVLRSLLRCKLPGTTNSFEDVFQAVSCGGTLRGTPQKDHCYLIGGQVRDVLRGKLSTDVDFNYSCTAQDVALRTVAQGWPTKFKCIGPVDVPNYVLIGDEGSSCYLEGFCIDFNATKACYTNDLTMNTLLYDLTNDVIIDKTGRGVSDIRQHALRLSLAAGETFAQWSAACITPGGEELRYIKFFLRAEAKGQPHTYDADECAHVVASLRDALRTNADALSGFWLGYTLKDSLQDSKGITMLHAWVEKHGGPAWWSEQWEPLIRKCATPKALEGISGTGGNSLAVSKAAPTSQKPKTAWKAESRTWPSWLSLRRLKSAHRIVPVGEVS